MERVDVLGARPERLHAFSGAVLSVDNDPALQGIARAAAELLGAPSSAVSLILGRIQFFRAHHGLAPALAAAGGTDRDLSYCQYVVRDEAPFEVTDAAVDPRVPQETTRRFGVRAYLGAPVRIAGQVVGSLCVFDGAPRSFSDADRDALTQLAERASARLEQLAESQLTRDTRTDLFHVAARPTFSELRNALGALELELHRARAAAAEAAPVARVLLSLEDGEPTPDLGWLRQAAASVNDASGSLASLEHGLGRVKAQILALESASGASRDRVSLVDAVADAAQLAHHLLKLVGGARWTELPRLTLQASRPTAVAALSAAFTAIADTLRGSLRTGLPVAAELVPGAVRVWMDAQDASRAAAAREVVAPLVVGEFDVRVLTGGTRLALEFAL